MTTIISPIESDLRSFYRAPRGGVTLPGVFVTLLPKYLIQSKVESVDEVRYEETLSVAKAAWFVEYEEVLPPFRHAVLGRGAQVCQRRRGNEEHGDGDC